MKQFHLSVTEWTKTLTKQRKGHSYTHAHKSLGFETDTYGSLLYDDTANGAEQMNI